MQGKVERNSNFELLRILSMILIIGGHVVRYGTSSLSAYDSNSMYGGIDYATGNLIYTICIVAVNVFVLISGYFGIRLKIDKIFKLELQIIFYSYALLVIGLTLGGVCLKDVPGFIFPFLSNKWWFITTYIVLCIISPLLNYIVENTNKRQLKVIVTTCIVLFYIWATISYTFNFKQLVPNYGGNIVNFIALYFTGRFVYLYYNDNKRTANFYLIAFIFITLSMYIIQLLISKILGFGFTSYANNDSIFVFLSALTLFLAFRKITLQSNRINRVAKYTLAVYIIHMNNIIMPFIVSFFEIRNMHGIQIFIASIYIPLVVYITCACIEWIRRFLFNNMENHICNIIFRKILKKNISYESSIFTSSRSPVSHRRF